MEPISLKIWTPDATSLTDTPDAQNQADNANKIPTPDNATKQFEVSRPIEGAELASHQVSWDDSGTGAVNGLWGYFKSVGEFFTNMYGKNTGLNPNFKPPETANKVWIS